MSNNVSRMEIQPDNIPIELKARDRWFLWKYELREDGEGKKKQTKPPYQPNGSRGKPNDISTTSPFEVVLKVLSESKKYNGIGFLLTEEDDLIAWDLDHCLNSKTGELEQWALNIVNTLNSYTEITPSGEGLRVFTKGKLPVSGRKKGPVECYQTLRFITVTGNLYPGYPTEINANSIELFTEVFEKKPEKKSASSSKTPDISKKEVILHLENGDWKSAGFPSQSEADYEYCKILADKFSGDKERVDRTFRESKLFRPKWDVQHSGDGRTYGQLTIDRAVKNWETQFRLTDLGNAKRFAQLIKDEVKFCGGRWYIWDGKKLAEDRLQRIYLLAQRVLDQLRDECKETQDDDTRKVIWKHMISLESKSKLEAMISLTQSNENIAMVPEELDKNPYIFNCENGMLDERGALIPHSFEELISKQSPVRINGKATCPAFEKFLDEILPSKTLQTYLQTAIGYSMTADISEQVLFFAYGVGANGKSTLFHIITKILGDYASQLPVESLMASKSDQHPTILADLRGVRFILASEPEEGRRFNEGLLKQITGGEKIVARRMREDFTRFDSTAKLWIMGNHKPNIRGTDNAIWRRINLIPFNVTIPKEKQDKELWVKLEAEQEGILLWMEKGRRNWLRNGLNPPDEVLIATQEYRNEMDVIQDFINEHVEEDIGNWLLHSSLYGAYAKSATDSNERVLSSKMFAQKMREKGYQDQRRTGNQLYWSNIKLKNFNDAVQRDL